MLAFETRDYYCRASPTAQVTDDFTSGLLLEFREFHDTPRAQQTIRSLMDMDRQATHPGCPETSAIVELVPLSCLAKCRTRAQKVETRSSWAICDASWRASLMSLPDA